MELDTKRIEDAVVAEIAEKLIGEREIFESAKQAIASRVDRLWSERVEAEITAAAESAVTAGFEHEYRKVDSFGKPQGEKTTIGAELEKLISGYWSQRVDRDGKTTDSKWHTTTRAEWLMAKMCADDFKSRLQQRVVDVSGSLKDAFRKELNATVDRLLSEVFRVRSVDDQKR